MYLRSAALLLALLPIGLANAAAPSTNIDLCTDLYRQAVDRQLQRKGGRPPKPADELALAYGSWLVAQRTGVASYRDYAVAVYDRLIQLKVDHDFHFSRPFGQLTWRLHQAGLLTGERRTRARTQAEQRINWFLDARRMRDEFFDCNIALADTQAVACLARTFADDPALRTAEIRAAVAKLGQRILEIGDLNENSSNYSSLGMVFFLELAKLEGWLDAVRRSAHFRTMFERMRDLISPTGVIPEYGDGYFRQRQTRLDFVVLLEFAARLYQDPSFQTAARRMIVGAPDEVEADNLNRGQILLEEAPFEGRDDSAPVLSVVQQRRIPGPPIRTVPDKLILRTGARPGAAMIMVDLYALGSHAHEYKRPSIGYYEAGGVPLFHNLGRRGTRSGQCGNSFWIFDRPETFPGYPQPGIWNTMTVPAEYCFPAATGEGRYQVGSSLLFRNFRTPELKYLRLDNLRLEGPKGRVLLDGFESAASWHANVANFPQVKLEASGECTQGAGSQQVNWSIFGEQFNVRQFEERSLRDTTYRLADYDTVRLDYKFEGQHPHCNLRNLFERWIDLGDRPLHCEVARAEAGQAGEDAWGRLEFTAYIDRDSRLERRIALTREGALVVVDTFTGGPRTHGWAGGQLWQLYALQDQGEDWFAGESDGAYTLPDGATAERRMLVKYMRSPEVTVASERVRPPTMHAPKADGSKHREFFTTYAKQPLQSGRQVVAAMVVLSVKPGQEAASVARGVTFASGRTGDVTVTIAHPAVAETVVVKAAAKGITFLRPDVAGGIN